MDIPDITIPVRDGITEGGLIIIGILSVVLAVVLVVGVAIWRFGSAISARIKAVQEQVANDHKKPDGTPINLRDDLDDKHVENAKKLDRTLGMLVLVQRDLTWVMRQLAEQDDRIEDLEDTAGRKRTP